MSLSRLLRTLGADRQPSMSFARQAIGLRIRPFLTFCRLWRSISVQCAKALPGRDTGGPRLRTLLLYLSAGVQQLCRGFHERVGLPGSPLEAM